mgnify:FL=1
MKCYNKVNGHRCYFCCWGRTNNIFYYLSLVFKKIFNIKLLENVNVW